MARDLKQRGEALLASVVAGGVTNDQAIVLLASALIAAISAYPVEARGPAVCVAVRGIEQGVAELNRKPPRLR